MQARADVTMILDNHDRTFSRIPAYFYTSTRIVNRAQEFDIDSVLAEFNFKVQQFNRRGSGFELERIVRFVLVINTYRPLHGSTYLETPDWLARKRYIVNVNNKNDNRCFLWSILASLYPAQSHISRLSHYIKHQSAVNMAGLDYPVSTKQIPHFEDNNPEISVNVLTVDEDAKPSVTGRSVQSGQALLHLRQKHGCSRVTQNETQWKDVRLQLVFASVPKTRDIRQAHPVLRQTRRAASRLSECRRRKRLHATI